MKERLRGLPAVDALLREPLLAAEAAAGIPRRLLVDAAREVLGEMRNSDDETACSLDRITAAVALRARNSARRGMRSAINATGVVLNTGLGRARLAPAAAEAVTEVALAHSPLEVDVETGRRGSRQSHVRDLLRRLTGAEEALVVNNNAAAVFLCVASLAAGAEVIVSRGQLVEIGGSFRIPDIIRQAGATLVEIGATNRTRLSDYEAAITERTALLLRCHPSNFRMVGFTEEVAPAELAKLGAERGIPLLDDIGSGCLIDTTQFGLDHEPTVQESVATGSGLVCWSGDKLLGGPQAGLIVGRSDLLSLISAHPLARAVRIDKLTLAALEATLRLYLNPDAVVEQVSALRYLSRSPKTLSRLARRLISAIRRFDAALSSVELRVGVSEVGGGSLPGQTLPTTLVAVRHALISAEDLARRLRMGTPPVFARVESDATCFDPRAINEDEIQVVARAIKEAVRGPANRELE